VNGPYNILGQRFDQFGSDDAALEGFFDISGLESPIGGNTTQFGNSTLEFEVESMWPGGYE